VALTTTKKKDDKEEIFRIFLQLRNEDALANKNRPTVAAATDAANSVQYEQNDDNYQNDRRRDGGASC